MTAVVFFQKQKLISSYEYSISSQNVRWMVMARSLYSCYWQSQPVL